MECSLFALLACFSWSNFYVDGGLSYKDKERPHQVFETHVNRLPGVTETITTQRTTDEPMNPYGRLALGYEMQFSSLSLALEVAHESSVETNDDEGFTAISLRARWHPFRR
jgi:hypothetical protein